MKTVLYAGLASLISGLLAGTPPALADDCPTRADLDGAGIRFDVEGGDHEVFRNHGPGILSSHYHSADSAQPMRVLLGQGVYLLESADTKDGALDPATRITYAYPMKPADMPLPTPGGKFTVSAAVLENGSLRRENQSYSFGPATTYTFGPCTYAAMEIAITYGDDDSSDTLVYLHDLGLSYLSGSTYGDTVDTYSYIAIRKAD